MAKAKGIRVLCVRRFGKGGEKDLDILGKFRGVNQVVSGDFHFRVGDAEENRKYLESLPQAHRNYYQSQGVAYDYFIDKSCDELVKKYLDQVDALYIPGAAFDPSSEFCIDEAVKQAPDKRREEFELKLIQGAKERGMPVLAICAGSWRLANAYGGKTNVLNEQDIASHDKWETIRMLTETAHIVPGTHFSDIHRTYQTKRELQINNGRASKELLVKKAPISEAPESLQINSCHWRVVDPETLNDNFRVNALSPEQHIEGFETIHGVPTFGFLFHPEYAIPQVRDEHGTSLVQDYKTHRGAIEAWIDAGQSFQN